MSFRHNIKHLDLKKSTVVATASLADETKLEGSCLHLEKALLARELVYRLEATLYGRDIIDEKTDTDSIELNIFEPDLVPLIPATWWDHLLHSLAFWLARHGLKETRWWHWRTAPARLGGWLQGCVCLIRAPQAFVRRRIVTKTLHRTVKLVCPHIGNYVGSLRHQMFLAYIPTDDLSFSVPSSGRGDPIPSDKPMHPQAVREHMFRHHLAALADQVDKEFGHDSKISLGPFQKDPCTDPHRVVSILMDLKRLFDQYGII